MFTPGEIEGFSAVLDKPARALEMRIMEDIVRRIKINGEITRSADWQINRLVQLGMAREDIQNALKDALSFSDDEVADMYRNVIKSGYVRDKALYEAVGANFIPFEENGELQQLISAVAGQTNETLKNITQSLGFAVREADGKLSFTPIADYYQQTLDGAMMDIASGAFDYNTVLKRTVREMTNSGLRTVDYATGWSNRVDVAARRAVMTGMTQLTAKINADNMEALGTDYVEVSWHGGARPTHQVWQGKVYYWDKGNRNDILENSQNTVDNSAKSGIMKIRGESSSNVIEWLPKGDNISSDEYKELRDYANKNGISLQGFKKSDVDTDLIKESIDSIKQVTDVFPELLGNDKKTLTLALSDTMNANDFASTDKSIGHIIKLNGNAFRDSKKLDKEYQNLVNDMWFVQGTDKLSIVKHELGHLYQTVHNISDESIIDLALKSSGKSNKKELFRFLNDNLSLYSGSYKDGSEIISEVFSDYFGSRTPSEFSKKFMNELIEMR